MLHRLGSQNKVVGTKQTIKALEKRNVEKVFVAKDADERTVRRVLELAKEYEVPIFMVDTMKQLGNACKVEVKTATAAIIN